MACFGCICVSCANNVESTHISLGESVKPCLNCDTCVEYVGYYLSGGKRATLNRTRDGDCDDYIISNHEATLRRSRLKIVKERP